jgi:alginate O-acetyltransferase complex protein AlgI
MVGWVFFRADTFGGALAMLRAMAGFADASAVAFTPAVYLRHDVVLALVAGVLFAAPILPALRRLRDRLGQSLATRPRLAGAWELAAALGSVAAQALLLLGSAMLLAANTYNPFIYFRF